MAVKSLKVRLSVLAALALAIALLIAGTSLYFVFQRYVESVALQQLQDQFVQLANNLSLDPDGKLQTKGSLSDPRFQKPYGGLYWQVNAAGVAPLRSRSLWDHELAPPEASNTLVHIIEGPDNSKLFALERHIALQDTSNQPHQIAVTLAIDRALIDKAVNEFGRELALGLGLLFAALLASSLMQTLVGLRPLETLRRGVEAIMAGKSASLDGNFPTEVEPLVDEMNALLNARKNELDRARLRAGNMAHGLKTPLTVMSAVADELAAKGQQVFAQEIRENANQMRNLIDRELARARMASGQSAQQTAVAPIVKRTINALKRTTENETLLWHTSIPADAKLPIDANDLLELVGNLLDNARKWAKSQIYVAWSAGKLSIEDDGPGVPDEQLEAIQIRGVRLDETIQGSGLGLGIVRDLCDAYGLHLKMKRSSLGGLSVSVSLKA